MPNYKQIMKLVDAGISQRVIAKQLGISRNTISSVVRNAKIKSISYFQLKNLDDFDVNRLFESQETVVSKKENLYELPDYEVLAKELTKPGVTMKLLWDEYVYECRKSGKIPYQITQFKRYFRSHLVKEEFTDVIHHKAGEQIQVDWAGKRVHYFDADTGEEIEGYLFVSCLAFSGYAYAEACYDMKEESWIKCHVHMYEYFGGVTPILVPDNLKTGVTKHLKNEEAIINTTYQEMGDYYGTVIIPARVRKPKDKPLAENTVDKLTTYIIAKLRNYKFFSLEEYNEQLRKELYAFNHKPFQKKEGSRASIYEKYDKPSLLPLPQDEYEISTWKELKVQPNSHISYAKKYYSVPYEYIGKKVRVRITKKELFVFYDKLQLCSHRILAPDAYPPYDTTPEHMPPQSNAYQEWNAERFKQWANNIGPSTYQVISNLFAHYKIEQQGYVGAKSLLKLADSYSNDRLEAACAIALEHLTTPRYRNIKSILEHGQDKQEMATIEEAPHKEKAFIRGGNYYKERLKHE